MLPKLRRTLTKKIQQVFWFYLTENFIISSLTDCKIFQNAAGYRFIPITIDNSNRVQDFRSESLSSEYRDKVSRAELGFFAERDSKMVGSIWATINHSQVPTVARTHIRLLPNEALIHDIVTGESYRGMGVGPFMVSQIASILLKEYQVRRIIVDVNARNAASLRMMNKIGLHAQQRVLYVSAFKHLILQRTMRTYS